MMKFRENEDAVSPVIGVILMVAITVILAAVIAAFVFGMTSDMPDTTKNVAIGVKSVASNNIAITVQGGSDLPRLEHMKITVDGDETNMYYTQDTKGSIALGSASPSGAGAFTIGSTWQTDDDLPLAGTGSEHVIVVGVFSDGAEQILADTYL